jgi:hypothetical protein
MVEILRKVLAPPKWSKRITTVVVVVMKKDLVEDVILALVAATPAVTAAGVPMKTGRLASRTFRRR